MHELNGKRIVVRQRPIATDTNQIWRDYWEYMGQTWRTEAEIDEKRQSYLAQRLLIVPDIQEGEYPFKGITLKRADIEWLLATHEDGRGPVWWSDATQRARRGLDMRGAIIQQVNLQGLPLARLRCSLSKQERDGVSEALCMASRVHLEKTTLINAQLQGADLHHAYLEGAFLMGTDLEGADLTDAWLHEVNFEKANLRSADLSWARLQNGSLFKAQLHDAHLCWARLERVDLRGAQLQDADLRHAELAGVYLDDVTFCSQAHPGPLLADVQWSNVNFAIVKWSEGKVLGDEQQARRKQVRGKKKTREQQIKGYEEAIRANRQLAVVLQSQGLNEDAACFAYRAQLLQKIVYRLQLMQPGILLKQRMPFLGAWLLSWMLFVLAGYGYKPERSFLAYLLVIVGFATTYALLGHAFGPSLTPVEAIVLSMTSFHGRGFFPGNTIQLDNPVAVLAALEAFVGLIIEVTFIATLTQRLFGKL